MLSEYRQRFGDFHTELHREDYLFRSGYKHSREVARIRGEHSDLFKSSAIAELRATAEETPEHRETEAASVKRLIAFAVEGACQPARKRSPTRSKITKRTRSSIGKAGRVPSRVRLAARR